MVIDEPCEAILDFRVSRRIKFFAATLSDLVKSSSF